MIFKIKDDLFQYFMIFHHLVSELLSCEWRFFWYSVNGGETGIYREFEIALRAPMVLNYRRNWAAFLRYFKIFHGRLEKRELAGIMKISEQNMWEPFQIEWCWDYSKSTKINIVSMIQEAVWHCSGVIQVSSVVRLLQWIKHKSIAVQQGPRNSQPNSWNWSLSPRFVL